MLEFKYIRFEQRDHLAVLTVNRPEKLNPLNVATIEEIREAMLHVCESRVIRGLIITGAGEKAFVAGADIEEVAKLNEVNGRKFAERGQEVFALVEECNKPVIAAVNGWALGGGCELAMACHLRVAAPNARFGLPEVTLGILPGYGGTQRLTQLVGKGRALEMMLTGEPVKAGVAKDIGLVNRVVETPAELLPYCEELMRKITTKAPLAVGRIIDCVNAYQNGENGYQTEANSFANCCKSEDFQEGTKAFLEKRKPAFKGK
ncbi:MAG: enoyl-CoA hydratase-related protein [Catalinimonas sp.]